MNRNAKLVLFTLLILGIGSVKLVAQPLYQSIQLNAPNYAQLESKYDDEDAVIVNDFRWYDMYWSVNKGYYKLRYFITYHKAIRLNTDAAIEKYNKVYISMRNVIQLASFQARTVKDDNTAEFVESSQIKELEKVDGYNDYKIFALEGVEKGSQIEYIYTVEVKPNGLGRCIYQHEHPVRNMLFYFKMPSDIKYEFKGYNGFPSGKWLEAEGVKTFEATKRHLPALNEEAASSYRSKLMRIDFKATATDNEKNLYSWPKIGKSYYKNMYVTAGGGKLKGSIKELGLKSLKGEKQIMAIEDHIKSTYDHKFGSSYVLEDFKTVLERKVGNTDGLSKLYTKYFELLGIKFNVIITNSRYDGIPDTTFSSYLDVSQIMFYFPKYKKFIIPDDYSYRYGPAPGEYGGSVGLKIDIDFDEFARLSPTGYSFLQIPVESKEYSSRNLAATVKLDQESEELVVDCKHELSGFYAQYGRYAYLYAKEPEKYLDLLTISNLEEFEVDERKVSGNSIRLNSMRDSVMTVHTELTTSAILKKAGDDYLVNIGKIIGSQRELYNEKNRVSTVMEEFKRQDFVEIKLEIPSGYTYKGKTGEQVRYDVTGNDDESLFGTNYSVELDGNMLVFKLHEYLDTTEVSPSRYEDYRKCINAAADFEKLSVVLVKE